MQSRKLVEDQFTITAIDPLNKTPFRNVSRVHLVSLYDGIQIEVDINTHIYPVTSKDSLLIFITNCDNLKNVYIEEEIMKSSERDNYEYVSYGMVFQMIQKDGILVIFASFGGLIMRLSGKIDVVSAFRKEKLDSRVLLMIRKA